MWLHVCVWWCIAVGEVEDKWCFQFLVVFYGFELTGANYFNIHNIHSRIDK
jgi:hypothetical protein